MIRATGYVQICDVAGCTSQRQVQGDDLRSSSWARWMTAEDTIDLCPDHSDLKLDEIAKIVNARKQTRECKMPCKTDSTIRPVAWLHNERGRYDVVHEEAKALWLKASPKQVEHYTIPLYRHENREPMSTDAACDLLRSLFGGAPPDGNLLKLIRAVERAHDIGNLVNTLNQERPKDD